MAWEVEFTPEFEKWWNTLSEFEQAEVSAKVALLEVHGPGLTRPHADVIVTSRYANMKELRASHRRRLFRVLFAFDPRRMAILLIGGDKTGDPTWYERVVPLADELYHNHLETLKREAGHGKKL